MAVRASTASPGSLSARLTLSPALVGPVLCAGLMAATAWAVLAGGWVTGGGGAVVVAVTAVVEAALLASARIPRWMMALLAPVLALAAIVPATVAAMPFDVNSSVGHAAVRYLEALVGGLGSNNDWAFTVGLCSVLWVCGYWLGWLALREHRGILAVLPLYAVLGTNVLNTKSPDQVGVPLAIAGFLSLLVVATAHLGAMQARWSRQRLQSLPGTGSRFAFSVGRATIILTLLAIVTPPLTDLDISGRFFSGNGATRGSGSQGSGKAPAGPGTIAFNPATQPGGTLTSKPQAVLQYTSDGGAPVYLRVVNDVHFTNGNWFPQRVNGPDSVTVGVDALPFSGGTLPRDRDPAHGGVSAAVRPVHIVTQMRPEATGNTDFAPFAGEPDAMALPGFAIGATDVTGSGLLTVDAVQAGHHVTSSTVIRTTGDLSTATADQLRAAGTDYPDFALEYTQLNDDPTQGAAAIEVLAREWTAGSTNPYDSAVAIETHLRDPKNFTYTLSPPAGPSDEWAVVYFLQTSHRGYCQYFASAMGAMLRSLQIPTRLVSGYGPGTASPQASRQGSRVYVVSTSDAHTWVEAYFPGYGWISFEPTPPSQQGNYQPFGRGANALPGGTGSSPTPPPSDTTLPGFTEPFAPNLTLPGGSAPAGRPAALLGLEIGAAAVVLLVIALVLWLLLPRSLPGAWRRIETVGAMLRLRRHPAETHREYAYRLAELRPSTADALLEIASVSGRAEFSPRGADQAERRHAIRLWRGQLFALVRSWRPLPHLRSRRAHI